MEERFRTPSPYEINLQSDEGLGLFADLLIDSEGQDSSGDYGQYANYFCDLEKNDPSIALQIAERLVLLEEGRTFVGSRIAEIIKAAHDPVIIERAVGIWIALLEQDSSHEIRNDWQLAAAVSADEFDPRLTGEEGAINLMGKIDPVVVSRIIRLADDIEEQRRGK